jgi:hypothetical protein
MKKQIFIDGGNITMEYPTHLNVTVPIGLTGRELNKWKKKSNADLVRTMLTEDFFVMDIEMADDKYTIEPETLKCETCPLNNLVDNPNAPIEDYIKCNECYKTLNITL